jgi:hypothetical protein
MKAESPPGGKIAARAAVKWAVRGGPMPQPDLHRDYVRERHSDLLRLARNGELAARLAASRREERKTILARLWRARAVTAS